MYHNIMQKGYSENNNNNKTMFSCLRSNEVLDMSEFLAMLLKGKVLYSPFSSSCWLPCVQVAGPAVANDKIEATCWNAEN